jgi:hypothetical protein
MTISFHTHYELDNPLCGADFYVLRLSRALEERGFTVSFNTDADVIISNLVYGSEDAIKLGDRADYWIMHNDINPVPETGTIIWNSRTLKGDREGLVMYPIPEYGSFVIGGGCITLVNCNHNKGGDLLLQLATQMPNRKFLGVHGGYSGQIQQPSVHGNLKYMPFQSDMSQVWRQTGILIVPSKKESWSMVAGEAQLRGIPVICSDLPGLREHMSDTCIYTTDYVWAIQSDLRWCARAGIGRQKVLDSVREVQLNKLIEHIKNHN